MNDRNERKFDGASWYINLNVNDTVLDNSMFNMGFSNQGNPKITVKEVIVEPPVAEEEHVQEHIENEITNEIEVETTSETQEEENDEVLEVEENQIETPIIKKRGRKPKTITE